MWSTTVLQNDMTTHNVPPKTKKKNSPILGSSPTFCLYNFYTLFPVLLYHFFFFLISPIPFWLLGSKLKLLDEYFNVIQWNKYVSRIRQKSFSSISLSLDRNWLKYYFINGRNEMMSLGRYMIIYIVSIGQSQLIVLNLVLPPDVYSNWLGS